MEGAAPLRKAIGTRHARSGPSGLCGTAREAHANGACRMASVPRRHRPGQLGDEGGSTRHVATAKRFLRPWNPDPAGRGEDKDAVRRRARGKSDYFFLLMMTHDHGIGCYGYLGSGICCT